MVPEYKKLGEMVLADPLLRSRVVVAKAGCRAPSCAGRLAAAGLACCPALQAAVADQPPCSCTTLGRAARPVPVPPRHGGLHGADACRAAQVDADAHKSLGEKFGVQGFPTIKFLPRGLKANTENSIA